MRTELQVCLTWRSSLPPNRHSKVWKSQNPLGLSQSGFVGMGEKKRKGVGLPRLFGKTQSSLAGSQSLR